MIDREARDVAADLVSRFRDGELTNDQFRDAWPTSSDRALSAISTMIWGFYDDLHEHTLTGRHALSADAYALMTRCLLFVKTNLPYDWPEDNFVRVASLGWRVLLTIFLMSVVLYFIWWPLAPLLIGGSLLLDRWIKRRNVAFGDRLTAARDMSAWPFPLQEDYKRATGLSHEA